MLISRCGAPPAPQSGNRMLGRAVKPAGDPCTHVGSQWGGGHITRPPLPPYPPGPPSPPPPPTQGFLSGYWVPPVGGWQQVSPPPATSLASLGLSDSAIHTFTTALQVVVAAGVSLAVPSPSPSALTGKVMTLSLLHLRFTCGVAVDGDLPPNWEAVARVKGADRGARHPEPGPDEGPAILQPPI